MVSPQILSIQPAWWSKMSAQISGPTWYMVLKATGMALSSTCTRPTASHPFVLLHRAERFGVVDARVAAAAVGEVADGQAPLGRAVASVGHGVGGHRGRAAGQLPDGPGRAGVEGQLGGAGVGGLWHV